MRILFIKLSSMGDIFHSYYALNEVHQHCPNVTIDWLVDRQFLTLCQWSSVVNQVYSIPLRAYRDHRNKCSKQQIHATIQQIASQNYDLIIDAQGLYKSAWLASKISRASQKKIPVAGFSFSCAREPLSTLLYTSKHVVDTDQHAIECTRQLMAKALGYNDQLKTQLPIALSQQQWQRPTNAPSNYGIIIPNTTWHSKHWIDEYWSQLIDTLDNHKQTIVLSWGNDIELARVLQLQKHNTVIPEHRLSFNEMAAWIAHADWVIGVDTGFLHLANALQKPVIGIFGATSPKKSGVFGTNSRNLVHQLNCSPCRKKTCRISKDKNIAQCMRLLTPEHVVQEWLTLMHSKTQLTDPLQ